MSCLCVCVRLCIAANSGISGAWSGVRPSHAVGFHMIKSPGSRHITSLFTIIA